MTSAARERTSAGAPAHDDVRRWPEVWFADHVRAVSVLQPDEVAEQRIMTMLGLVALQPERAAELDVVPVVVSATTTTTSTAGDDAPPSTTAPVLRRALRASERGVRPVVEAEPMSRSDAPRQIPELDDVLPPPQPPLDQPATLLAPLQQRTILSTISSREARVGDVDVESLVQTVARGHVITVLPRELAVTTSFGLQLLLDFGAGMRGFQRDRDEAWSVVRSVAGEDGLDVLRFAGAPLLGGAGPGSKSTWSPYTPPPGGRAVLAITDLGTRPATVLRETVVDAWARTAAALRLSGSPLVALVPAPLRRVPDELRAVIDVVSWDRATSIRDARAAARRASNRLPSGQAR